MRAATATLAAFARSASGSTIKGSEPPSSSTHFFISRPAVSATWLPAFSLPVSVTALIRASAITGATFEALIAAHLTRLTAGDYCALLAYIDHDPRHVAALTALRQRIRDRKRVATCVGFGPRFLHSTGQAYKGGPDSGVFLQITSDDTKDLAVPSQKASFGVIKAAQGACLLRCAARWTAFATAGGATVFRKRRCANCALRRAAMRPCCASSSRRVTC